MNETYYNFAIKKLENITPAELKAKLEEHGFEVKSVHSGKTLAELPIEEIWEGMDVFCELGLLGKVTSILPPIFVGKGHWITVDWQDGKCSYRDHSEFTNVTVE